MEDNGNSFFVILKTKFMYTIRGFLSNSINGNLIILSFFFFMMTPLPSVQLLRYCSIVYRVLTVDA